MGNVQGSCDTVLQASVQIELGTNPLCMWVNDTALIIALGQGFTLGLGHSMALKDNVIRSWDNYSDPIVSSAVPLQQPFHGPIPTARISGLAAVVSSCDGIRISAGTSDGNANRPFEYFWLFIAHPSSNLPPSAYVTLNAKVGTATDTIELDAEDLKPGEYYTITLSLKNWLGTDYTVTAANFTKSALALPKVEVKGPKLIDQDPTTSLRVGIQATPPCGTAAKLSYHWTMTVGSHDFEIPSPDVANLFLGRDTLQPGLT
jgi:hypothetical protein